MLFLAFSIFLCSFPFATCQDRICFSYNLDGNCEVEGNAVSKSEIKSLQDKCKLGGELFNQNLNLLEFQNTEVTGLQPFSSFCKNHEPARFAWAIWNKYSEFFKENKFLKKRFTTIFAKSRGSGENVLCSLDTQSGYCRPFLSENTWSLRDDSFYILAERKPFRYEVRNFVCEKGYIFNTTDVVLENKTFENFQDESTTITDTISYFAKTSLDLKLDDIPMQQYLPSQIEENNLILHRSHDSYSTFEIKHVPIIYKLEPNVSLNIVLKTQKILRKCEAKVDLVTFYDDATFENSTFSFEATKTYLLDPGQQATFNDIYPNTTWITVLAILGGLLLLIILICIWLQCCGGADLSGWLECCCMCCEICANCNCPG